MGDEIIQKISVDVGDSVGKVDSVRTEIRKLKESLLEIPRDDPRWPNILARYTELTSKVRELGEISRAGDPHRQIENWVKLGTAGVGAFTAVRSAANLFGVTNNETLKKIQEITDLMGILQGLRAFGEGIREARAMYLAMRATAAATRSQIAGTAALAEGQVAQAGASRGAAIATNLLGGAMKALGIGLIIAAIAYLVDNWKELKKQVTDLFPSLNLTSQAFDKFKQVVVGVGGAVVNVLLVPIKELIQAVKTTIQVFEDLKGGNFKKAFTDIGEGIKEGIVIAKDGLDVVKHFNEGVQSSIAAQAEEKNKKILEDQIKHETDMIAVMEASGKDSYKLSLDLISKKKKLYADDKEKLAETLQEERILHAEHGKMLSEEAKKALEKKLAEEKKEVEEEEKSQEDHLKRMKETREREDELEKKELEELGKANIDFVNQGQKVDENSNAWKLQQLNKTYAELKEKNKGNLAELIAIDISYNNQKKVIEDDQTKKDIVAKDQAAMKEVTNLKSKEATELSNTKLSYAAKIAIAKKFDADLKKIIDSGDLNEQHSLEVKKDIGEGKKKIDLELSESQKKSVAAIGGSLNALSGIVAKNSVAGKAIAVGQATINTFQGASLALASSPPPFNFIEMAAVVAAGIANVEKIIKTKVAPGDTSGGSIPGTGGAGLAFNAPSIQSNPNTTNLSPSSIAGIQNASQQQSQVVVSESDITQTQQRVSGYQQAASIGGN